MQQYATPPRFGTQPLEQDDLFATPRAAAPITHAITCAVCGTATRIYVAAPGDLCDTCRADVPAMRAHVEDVVELARARLHVLINTFEDAVARESPEDQARWEAVVTARVGVQRERKRDEDFYAQHRTKTYFGDLAATTLRARLQATLALADGLSRILVAHEELEKGCGEVEQQELWGVRALGEIAIAEGAGI